MNTHLIYRLLIAHLRYEGYQCGELNTETNWSDEFEVSDIDCMAELTVGYPTRLLPSLRKAWGLSASAIYNLMVVPVPSKITALVLANYFRKQFDEFPSAFRDTGELRVNRTIYRDGLLVPSIRNKRIERLRVYRHPYDKESFEL